MNKRQFIKACGFCALSGMIFGGCTNSAGTHNKDKIIDRIEIPVSYHCNVNCAYCDHFAPIAPFYNMPVDIFEKDLSKLRELTSGKIGEMVLFGGEPLLNPELETLIKITADYFPESKHTILTNGLILNEMKESFWKICSKTGTEIKGSIYRLYPHYPDNFETADKYAQKYGVKLTTRDCYRFYRTLLNTKPVYNEAENYKICPDKIHCSTLDNGILYICALASSIKFINNYFPEKKIKIYAEDMLDIHKISSVDEILDFYSKPKKICAHCGYYTNRVYADWRVSEKKAEEWFS